MLVILNGTIFIFNQIFIDTIFEIYQAESYYEIIITMNTYVRRFPFVKKVKIFTFSNLSCFLHGKCCSPTQLYLVGNSGLFLRIV